MALTGLRYSDVSQIKQKQLFINGLIRDSVPIAQQKSTSKRITFGLSEREAKKRSTVDVRINEQVKDIIQDAMQLCDGRELLFESDKRLGKPYTAQYINRILKVVAFELKLNYELSTHSFRASH